MKKSILAVVSTLTILSGSLFGVSAATAGTFPNVGTVDYTVGESVSLNLGCGESEITSVWFDYGTLPDGLTIDSKGLVTGIPTTVGNSTLTGYHCSFGQSISWAFWSFTFRINPIVTPDPILSLQNLNTSDWNRAATVW